MEPSAECGTPGVSVADVVIVGTQEQPAKLLVDKLMHHQSVKATEFNDKVLNIIYKDRAEFLGITYPIVNHPSSSTVYICLDQEDSIHQSLEPFERHFDIANQFINETAIRSIMLLGDAATRSEEGFEEEAIYVNLESDKDIEAAYATLVNQGMYHSCPNALASIDRTEKSFVDGAIFKSRDLSKMVRSNHVVQVNEQPRQVLHLQPKCFDSILMVPRVYQDTYVKFSSEISQASEIQVLAALDEGLICGRSLMKTLKATLYEGQELFDEETCLLYFIRCGIIISTPVPRFVKKAWNERVPWFYNPFAISANSSPTVLPEIHSEDKIQTKQLLFNTQVPADFFGIVCLVLHEFCTPKSVYIGGQLAWGRCRDVTVVIQKTPTSTKGECLLHNLDEVPEHSIYISVLNPAESPDSGIFLMMRVIHESLQESISKWNGLEFKIKIIDSCLTTVAACGDTRSSKSHNGECSYCGEEAELKRVKTEYDVQQRLRKRDLDVTMKPRLCTDGNFSDRVEEGETSSLPQQDTHMPHSPVPHPKHLVRRKTSASLGYASLTSNFSMASITRPTARRQDSFDIYKERKGIDTRMSWKDMQLAQKFMDMNSICCIGTMLAGRSPGDKPFFVMQGTGILVQYDEVDDNGVIITAHHVVQELTKRNPDFTNVFLSFDYMDDTSKPNLTHCLDQILMEDQDRDLVFLYVYKRQEADSMPPKMVDFSHMLNFDLLNDFFWTTERRLLLIGHSQNSVKAAEIAKTENSLLQDLR